VGHHASTDIVGIPKGRYGPAQIMGSRGSNMQVVAPNISLQRTAPCGLAAELGPLGALTRRVPVIFVALAVSGCVSMDSRRAVLTRDDQEIILAVLNDPSLLSAGDLAGKPLLRKRTNITPAGSGTIYPGMDLKKQNQTEVVTISPDLATSISERNRARADLRSLSLPAGWEILLEQTDPRAPEMRRIVTVSLPGLSADGSQALVCVERAYNLPCCPQGYAVLLERQGERWVIVAHGAEWVV
jgi:hypothetical protein